MQIIKTSLLATVVILYFYLLFRIFNDGVFDVLEVFILMFSTSLFLNRYEKRPLTEQDLKKRAKELEIDMAYFEKSKQV